jgi:hypothetical protein
VPSTCIPVSPRNCQSNREGLSWQDQARVEQRRPLGTDYRSGGVRLTILVYPFYRIVDSDRDSFVDRVWIGTRREIFLKIRYVEP